MPGPVREVALARSVPAMLVTFGLSAACLWANKHFFNVRPASLAPEFQAAAAEKDGVAERASAPPVFLNPISRHLPGGVRGPEDVPA